MSQVITFQLAGLHCESCEKITEKRVNKIDGVENSEVNLEASVVSITATRQIGKSEVQTALEGTHYQVL